MNEESILRTIKDMLGPSACYSAFDYDIMMHINMAINILFQLGVGDGSFSVTSEDQTWGDYIGDDPRLNMVKDYIYAKVRKVFDPPASSTVMTALNETISELEWRINVQVDPEMME